jgi:hypothetical protein
VEKEQSLPANWEFTFGIQPTPVKPLPKSWRSLRLYPAESATHEIIWPEPSENSFKYYGYPEVANHDSFLKRLENINKSGRKALPYLCLTHLSMAAPEWQQFNVLWNSGYKDDKSGDVGAYGAPFAMIYPGVKGWQDFIVSKNIDFLKKYNLSGMYHDNTQPYRMILNNGDSEQTDDNDYIFPIFAYRDLYKRMYRKLKESNESTFSIAHMSGKMNIPVLAFEDAFLNGEQFRGKVQDNYLDVLSMDAFRAEFMGRQWGVVPIFLPQFESPHRERILPTRGMMAILLVHDVIPWPIRCNKDVVNHAYKALDAFGHVNATFLPYFDQVPPASTDMPDVFVSAYQKEHGTTLLIVANPGRQSKEGMLTLNRSRLSSPFGYSAYDWPGKTSLTLEENSLQIKLAPQSYRLIYLDPK